MPISLVVARLRLFRCVGVGGRTMGCQVWVGVWPLYGGGVGAHPYELIDVFTDQPLAGNQLAVFQHGEAIDEALLRPLARELNLSETVFLFPPEANGHNRMRIFTTWSELPFAGHPVLGAAGVVARRIATAPAVVDVRLETAKGTIPVTVELLADGKVSGWMQQPIPTVREWLGDQDTLVTVLGVPAPITAPRFYDNGVPHLYLMLPRISDVLGIDYNPSALRDVCAGARINCFAGEGSSYTSRMFSPFDLALPEDPACGSAAGPLAAYLLHNRVISSGQVITIAQGEKVGRPSTLQARAVEKGGELDQVRVGGFCCPVGAGEFRLP